MQAYKLYSGAVGLGLSPVQIIKSGRVKMVQFSGSFTGTNTQIASCQVGIAAVSEVGVATASPQNFAGVRGIALTGLLGGVINESVPCDYPVSAGQSLVLNTDDAAATQAFDVIVWVA